MVRKLIFVAFVALLLAPVLTSAQDGQTVLEVIVGNAQLNTFESAITAAGLEDLLDGDGPFTVFAPTDSAFRSLPVDTLEALNSDPTGALRALVRRHIVHEAVAEDELADVETLESDLGEDLEITNGEDGVVINGSATILRTLEASNGVVYVVDSVLFPPAATDEEEAEEANTQAGAQTTTQTTTRAGTQTQGVSAQAQTQTQTQTQAQTTTSQAQNVPVPPDVFEQAPVHTTGLNMQVMVVEQAPIYINPITHGNQVWPPGIGLLLCETATITETYGNFGKLANRDGWIPLTATVPTTSGFGCGNQ